MIDESSLTRLIRHSQEHDCAIITACRKSRPADINEANDERLCRILLKSGFGVTTVIGTFQEAGKKPGIEKSFFTVNLSDSPKFIWAIMELGEANSQDGVFIIPKGGFVNPKLCYLVGTSRIPAVSPRYHEKQFAEEILVDKKWVFKTKIKNRFFAFKLSDRFQLLEFENGNSLNSYYSILEKQYRDYLMKFEVGLFE